MRMIHKSINEKKLPVTLSLSPTKHPKIPAKSPTIAVRTPIMPKDTKKQGQPPATPAGGIKAKIICKRDKKWNKNLINIGEFFKNIKKDK